MAFYQRQQTETTERTGTTGDDTQDAQNIVLLRPNKDQLADV